MHSGYSLPAEILTLVENTPNVVLLHHASPQDQSPLSRLFLHPQYILEARQTAEIPALFTAIEEAVAKGLFVAGYLAYECGAAFEPTAGSVQAAQDTPLAWFGVYRRCFLYDHALGSFRGEEPPQLAGLRGKKRAALDAPPEARLAMDETEYAEKIAAIHEWIRRGDVYQLNYTLPMQVKAQAGAAALYARLIRRQPVEYAAFLHSQPGRYVLSFSPELFFRLQEGKHIVTRPMKGTCARGRFTTEDRALATALQNDPKNRAENLMIVDLLRNDLGRLCRFGSVQAEALFAVERHPTLWQMTSTVRGELRPDVSYAEIFRALFPCGSITGAPKVRAMQLIGELEGRQRGVYTGVIGYFSKQETVFNVAIRTLEMTAQPDGGLSGAMGVGGGIVIDSEAKSEFRECALKAEFLTGSAKADRRPPAEGFELIETMLWRQGIPRLELHLDRLQDSAEYFGFVCDRAVVRAAVLEHAARFMDALPRKLRLLLDGAGRLTLSDELFPEESLGLQAAPVRLCLAAERTDATDPLFFHKTTHRPLYALAWQRAQQAGYGDVLFQNQQGEVTESTIANLFVEKDGCLWTPPQECGLLAGVERRHILATHGNARERVLTLDDLRNADAIYLSNALRGLRRAAMDGLEL